MLIRRSSEEGMPDRIRHSSAGLQILLSFVLGHHPNRQHFWWKQCWSALCSDLLSFLWYCYKTNRMPVTSEENVDHPYTLLIFCCILKGNLVSVQTLLLSDFSTDMYVRLCILRVLCITFYTCRQTVHSVHQSCCVHFSVFPDHSFR